MSGDEPLRVRTVAHWEVVPPSLADDADAIRAALKAHEAMTPEQRESARQWAEQQRRERQDAAKASHAATLEYASGLARAVLELHCPEITEPPIPSVECGGCETDREGLVEWPCQTYRLARDWREDQA